MADLLKDLARVRELIERANPQEWVLWPGSDERISPNVLRLDFSGEPGPDTHWWLDLSDDDGRAIVASVNFLRAHAADIEDMARKALAGDGNG